MYLKKMSSYLSGLTNMASYCSKEIGPSYIDADCFEINDYIKDFSKVYEVPENSIKLDLSDLTLEDVFKSWLGSSNMDLTQGLIHWIRVKAGSPKKVYELNEESNLRNLLGISDGGLSPFYIFEDIYFVEFDKFMICFLLGNDE